MKPRDQKGQFKKQFRLIKNKYEQPYLCRVKKYGYLQNTPNSVTRSIVLNSFNDFMNAWHAMGFKNVK